MKFIDDAIIYVESGNGGQGCVSFRRERFIPHGGPDGGDGGKGGDVVLSVTLQRRTLSQFQYKKHFKAKNGFPGLGKQKTGKSGIDTVIEIPAGTIVSNSDSGNIIKDFVKPGEKYVIARGGQGGQGNRRFKSSKNRSPRFAQPGEKSQKLKLHLELKLIAHVGIVGLPNAGKSTLISAISRARPKIGNYPFTTIFPNLGVVKAHGCEPFVVADIPGLIEGAHEGAGLGIQFLRHIERTQILVHLIDISTMDPNDPKKHYETINNELALYSQSLAKKPQIVVLNKIDINESKENADKFLSVFKENEEPLIISAISGKGINGLISKMLQMLD